MTRTPERAPKGAAPLLVGRRTFRARLSELAGRVPNELLPTALAVLHGWQRRLPGGFDELRGHVLAGLTPSWRDRADVELSLLLDEEAVRRGTRAEVLARPLRLASAGLLVTEEAAWARTDLLKPLDDAELLVAGLEERPEIGGPVLGLLPEWQGTAAGLLAVSRRLAAA